MAETLEGRTREDINASVARGEESKWNVNPITGELLSEGYTYDYDLEKVAWVGLGSEPNEKVDNSVDTILEEETVGEVTPTSDPLQKIFDYAADEKRKWYRGSYEEFKNDYSTEEKQLKLYDILKKKKLYRLSKGEFLDKYFPIPAGEEVKGDPSQEGAAVEGEDGASNSENYSSDGKLKADSEGNTVNESYMGAKVEVDDLDASGLVELDEEALEAYFKRNIPLASTNQSGVPMTGNAVRVKLPGMEEVEIDNKAFSLNPFGPSNDELKKIEADKMQALIDHNKKLEGMPYLNAFKTKVDGFTRSSDKRIDPRQFSWIQKSYKDVMGIDIVETERKIQGLVARGYKVSDADGGVLFEGDSAAELQDYIYNNPPNKAQAKLLAEKTREGRENNFGDKTVKEDIAAQTNEVVTREFLTTKSGYGTLIANNMGLEEGEKWGTENMRDPSDIQFAKTKSSTISNAISMFMRQQKSSGLSTNNPKQFVEKFTEWMDTNGTNFGMEPEFNMIKENIPALESSLAAITANDGQLIKDGVAGLRVKNIANIKEENLKNGGFQNLIVANDIHTKEELLSQRALTEADIKKFKPTIEKDTAKFKKQYQDIYDKAGSDGITSIDQNKTTGLFTVKGNNAEVAKQYQAELNALSNTVSKKQAYYNKQGAVLNEQYNSQAKQLGLADVELSKSMKNFSLGAQVSDDIELSFSSLVYQPGALLGNKAAIDKINIGQETNAELYPEMDFSKGGWNYTARTWAQQSGVLALAIATQGAGASLGLTEAAIATTTASMFAVGAAGGKRAELEGQLQNVDMTHQAILELESMKETMDPEQYNKSRLALVKARDDSNMSNTQKWGLIVSTGIIEGTVTRYLGTIPNLSKTWKAVTNPLDDVAGIIARKNLKATGSALFQMGKSVGGEILEEEIIHFGTAGAEAAWLGKEVDFSGWQDVALSAIMVAGPMNGPGIAYSTYAQQVATKAMRENHYRITGELGNIDAELLALDINSETYAEDEGRVLDARQKLIGELTSMNSEMELQVMGLGAENMANMVTNGRRITEMSQEANVDPSLDMETQTEQVKAYAETLEPDAKEAFMKKWNSAINGKNDAFSKKAEWKNVIEKVYGDKGKSIYDALVKDNPELKDATDKEKAIAVHEEFKKQRVDVAIGKAKSNPNIVSQVENFIYGMSWKEAESKGYERQQGAENNAYQRIGESVQTDVRTGVKLIKEQSKQAAGVLGNKRLKNLKLTEAKTDEELIRETNKAYDAMYELEAARIDAGSDEDVKGMSDADKESAKQIKRADLSHEAEQSIAEIKTGATNGIIVGNEYIVRDIKAGNAAVREGQLLAGTVMSHEISHAVDNLAFSEGGLLNYGENLFEYMAENHPEVHAEVLQGQEQIGNYSRQGDAFPRDKQLFFDEYTKMTQDIIQRPGNKKDYDKIQKLNQSMPNALRAMTRGDYAIDTPRDAAVYLGSFVDGFKNDKLGRLQERKIDARGTKGEVSIKTKKSANISPVLHSQANAVGKEANDLYANKANNPGYAYDIAKLFEPMLGKYLNRIEAEGAILGKQDEYGQVSGSERAQNIADYKMNGMYAKRGIVDLVENGFNPEEMIEVTDPATGEMVLEPNTISKYLNGAFPQRLSEFTKNTTIDFTGFKVNLDKAANVVTTETDQAINNILTASVQDQLRTPLLSGITLSAEQIVILREAVSSIVGRKLPALDADVSKNRSVTPLVAALKKELAIKGSALHNLVYEIIGKSKVEVEQFLTDPKNKKMMLDALTTTWLAKNIPMAVQKYVVGVGYTTDHIGRKKGTKSGDIQAWKSSEDGPYKGMTDGKQKIRRNPNAIKDVSNAMLLSMFNKGVTMTDVKRAGLEKLSLALTQELGLEAFKADMINEGPLKELFVGRQDLFDRTLAGNFVEEFVRQTERGVTKYSENVQKDYGLGNPEDALTEERIGVAAYNLIKNVIQNYDKNQRYGGLEAELEGYPSYMVEAFTEAGIFEMFDTERKAKFVAPTKAMNWYSFGKAKEAYLNNGTQSKVMKDLQADNSSAMLKKLPPQLIRKLGPEFFGLGSERGLDGSFKKRKGGKGEYNWLRIEFDEASKPELDWKDNDPRLVDGKGKSILPFDISKVEMLNSSSGLMSSIETIQDMDVSRSKKIELLQRLKPRIDGANANNKKFLTWVLAENAKLIANNPEHAAGLASLMQGATNNVKGFRGYTGLGMIKLMDGSQAPYLTENGKPTRINTGIVNTGHPDYSRALAFAGGDIELAGKVLIYKGEHIDPSANVSQRLFALTLELADLLSTNPKALHKQILVEFQSKMDQEVRNYDQSLGTKLDSDVQDATLTSTNESAYARNLVIEDQLKHYVNTDNFGAIEDVIRNKTVGMLQLVGISERLKAKRLKNADTESKKSKNPKGITVLDFDDTLATTKSGVRANIPNADGLPKPGRKVIFLAGGAGSGKGNVISKLGLKDQGFKVVNSDISLEWLKKNSGLPENMNDFTKEQRSKLGSLQYQARGIARRKMMKYQGEGGGVVVDGTGGSIKSMENLVNEFKAKGYDVSMVFTETSLDVALERNAARKERSLLDKIVEKNHESVQGNKDGFKEMFGDRFMEVNTDNLSQKDAMPSKLTNKMNDFVSGYENRRLDAEEFARDGASILAQGGTFDFSEFNEVVEGQTAPLFEKAMKLQEKFGNKDMFVLTARPVEAAPAIFAFLQANGLKIPLKNITGLANSTAEAKALWMADKVADGYNDFYFADDALQNVQAVQSMLDRLDVKSKVQQAKLDFVNGDPQVVKLLEESSINDVKDIDRLTKPGTYNNIKFSKNHRIEYENIISKNRLDLVKEGLVSKTVDRMFDFIDGLDVPTDKRRKYEKITTKWLATSNVKLGEDSYKIQQAVELAEKHNKDIFSYNNPNEIIEAYAGKSKAEPTNPKNVKEFGEGRVFNKKHGITVHEVEDTKEGMMAVRKVADTHWGPKSNPWCIIARSEKQRVEPRQYGYESVATKSDAQARKQQLESEGFIVEIRAHKKDYRGIYPGKSIDGKRVDMRYELDIKEVKEGPGIMEDAWQNWTVYDKSRKYIVFQNGRLSSFYADDQYWDRMDSPTDAPVIQIKKGNVTSKVELVPIGDGNVDEFVMETRTTSKDKKTVTTEVLHETQDGYEVGTKIIENRVNGITVKSTRSRPGFDRQGNDVMHTQEIINFDKSGKATNNVTFNSEGLARAINRYGMPFGEMSINDIVQEKGDLLSHEVNDGDISYYYGDVLINGQKTEIGWGMPSDLDLRDFVTTSPNGEVRADLKKLLEVDPNVKGLPKGNTMFSKGVNREFNDILEGSTGVESIKEFSDAQARLRGQKTKYKSIIPASAQDFQGLLYNFLGKGKQGEKDMAFFKKALIDPFARGINELNASRQSAANDFENLNKRFPEVKKELNKSIEGLDYTYDQAMRVYLWNKAGFEVPGLSMRDLAALTSVVENNPEMKAYADAIGLISKKDAGYSKPKDYWLAESIASDLLSDGAIGDLRSDLLAEWIENKNIIFSKENLNKIEAIYGSKFREALEDMLYRMETGRNRPTGGSRLVNGYMNWVNNSVGAIMFINMRSATLQTISATNYLNWTDNNPAKAAAAFANQPQFWSDFSMIWNSPYLKQRRSGNQRGINEAELSEAIAGSDNKAKAALAWLLKKGFTPTQLADSFAISMGGATFLRNRINKYIKEGMSQKDAEAKAWIDFQETTEVNQQSARPDMISQQQASPLGRLILAFQNTPMQYARIMNKATRDLANGRGDYKTHISKIAYYGFVQSIIFGALQSALYASLGDDEEEDFDKKKERILNQMVDSWLSGIGVGGKAIGTVKNTIMEYFEQRDKGWNADHAYTLLTILSFSPPIGSKLRKIYSSIKTEEFNRGVFEKRGFSLDNPIWSGIGNVIEGVTNAPLGRMANLMLQLDNAMDSSHAWWQRVALILGQNTWDLGIKDPDIEAVKGELAEEKKVESKKRAKVKKEEKKKEKVEENKVVIEENKKKSKKDGICSAVSKGGGRCKTKVVEGKLFCTVHESTTKRPDGKETQCRKRKSDGKRCGMKTTNKSGYCYYHD